MDEGSNVYDQSDAAMDEGSSTTDLHMQRREFLKQVLELVVNDANFRERAVASPGDAFKEYGLFESYQDLMDAYTDNPSECDTPHTPTVY